MSEFSELKAKYIALAGKNPSPMSTDALRAKVEELEAAAAAPAADEPAADEPAADEPAADEPAADEPAADEPAADEPAADEAAADEQSIEDACAELGISPDKDGQVSLELLVSLAGEQVKSRGDEHVCDAAEAVRLIRAEIAKPRG